MSRIVLNFWSNEPPVLDAEVRVIVDGQETVYHVVSIERMSDHPTHYELEAEADDGADDELRYFGARQ